MQCVLKVRSSVPRPDKVLNKDVIAGALLQCFAPLSVDCVSTHSL